MPRRRIDWTPEEVAAVTDEITRLYLTDPELSVTELFAKAQDNVLDKDRHRAVTAFQSAKNILVGLKERLAGLKKNLNVDFEMQSLEQRLADTQKELDALKTAHQSLQAENAALKSRPSSEDVIKNTSTEKLFFLTLTRFVAAVTKEREKLSDALLAEVTTRLSGERHNLETRMHEIQNSIANLARSTELPSVAATALGEENTYMPNFLVAGLKREDFQRLQHSLMKANLRLAKVDVSQPTKISVAAHDRLFLFERGLTKELIATLTSRSRKVILLEGTLHDLQTIVVKEAETVRQERNS